MTIDNTTDPDSKWIHNAPPGAPVKVHTGGVDSGATAGDSHSRVEPLWHYTTFEALESITRTRMLWASKIQYLNDEVELQHARDVILRTVELRIRHSGLDFPPEDRLALKSVYDQAAGITKCVVCFSKSRDQLSQWRGYAKSTTPIAIGFDPVALAKLAESQNHGWGLKTCVYSDDDKADAVASIADQLKQNWPQAEVKGAERRESIRTAGLLTWDQYLHLAPALKHRGFREEGEVRLVSMPFSMNSDVWKYRKGGELVVPYVEFPLHSSTGDMGVIREILVGPTPNRQAVSSAISLLCHSRKLSAMVRTSEIPYR